MTPRPLHGGRGVFFAGYTGDMCQSNRRPGSLGSSVPVFLVLWLIAQAPVHATDYRAGNLVVAQPWSPPTPPVASVGAVYFSVTNGGPKADLLLSVTAPIAREVEIHESREVQGSVRMREVASVECPPGTTVKISPGGLHVMLLGLTRPLTAGMTFPVELHFRDAGVMTIQVLVAARE
jgi:periplasmic copper chaperone A